MNAAEPNQSNPPAASGELPLAERIALAQAAFDDYFPMCFWSWDPKTRVTEAMLPNIAHELRLNGGRRQFLLSEKICHSTIYRARFLPRFADDETPTAT
ncbi:MAG: hypothetical protein EXS37_06140 [Opitutus sp.]|nr:hypothetical protein [Opitutus sp.]